jgi:CRP-like cAMP-binding protein
VGGYNFLERLDPTSRDRLEALGAVRRYPARSYVMNQGEASGTVAVIRSGLVKITKSVPDGRSALIALRGDGELIGELAALDTQGRSASVTTVVDSELLVLRGDVFAAACRDHRPLADAVMQVLAERVRELSRQVIELSVGDSMARVCGRLVELVGMEEVARILAADGPHPPIELPLPVSQEEIGAWTGMSREAVVKAMRRLRDLGWVETGRRSVTIYDLPAVYGRSPNAY